MSVLFEAWFATRDRATKSSKGWRERGQSGSRLWVPGLLKRFWAREWLQGLGSLGCAGLAKGIVVVPFVSWLLNLCSPAGSFEARCSGVRLRGDKEGYLYLMIPVLATVPKGRRL